MRFLVEDPVPILGFGIATILIMGVILLFTGRGLLLYIMGGVLVLMLAALGLEWLVVTDPERVEVTIEAAAAALQTNNREAVYPYIDPSAGDTRELVDWGLRRVKINEIKITELEVQQIDYQSSPPVATARVVAIVLFRDRRGEIPYDRRLFDGTIKLSPTDDRWLITDHTWQDDPRR